MMQNQSQNSCSLVSSKVQDLTVSAIIDSETPLEQVELRSITMDQTDSE